MNRTVLAAFAAATLMAGAAAAQPRVDFSQIEQKVTDLGHRTYWIEGAGGNTTVAVGNDGIIMVDGQFAPLHDKLKAAIAKISDKSIRFLVNTHYHGDHTGGNVPFAKDGVTVVAHENVKKRLSEGTTNGLTGNRTPPAPESAWPVKTYKNWTNLRVAGRTALLKHPAPAHTDGDTYVYFKDANVLATGDIVTINRYPNIDFAVGGGIDGMIAAVDGYLELCDDGTRIVPGHGPVVNKARLAEYRALLATARERVAKLIAEGKSEPDAVAAKPFAADLDKQVNANEQQATNFVRVVYNSLRRPAAKS